MLFRSWEVEASAYSLVAVERSLTRDRYLEGYRCLDTIKGNSATRGAPRAYTTAASHGRRRERSIQYKGLLFYFWGGPLLNGLPILGGPDSTSIVLSNRSNVSRKGHCLRFPRPLIGCSPCATTFRGSNDQPLHRRLRRGLSAMALPFLGTRP